MSFEQMSEVTVRYVSTVNELRHPDIVFLPGSKNTMGDHFVDETKRT